ncbi:hypothetical protein GCM10022252_79190 [Streptosporangium oxazolinicum]|uniref:Polyhydroxybutyrate depolymerase n=1 Tax=Streptosporangium oxazolinicum TaxID=909287 RepID=A0ABP8BNN4_9ACTN
MDSGEDGRHALAGRLRTRLGRIAMRGVIFLMVPLAACGTSAGSSQQAQLSSQPNVAKAQNAAYQPAAAQPAANAKSARAAAWTPSCPTGFVPRAGLNSGFSSDGRARQFHVRLPANLSTPRPVFVSLTGTVQSETDFMRQSGLDQLTAQGWIVVAPVRLQLQDGRNWPPWFDGHPDPRVDEGPDVRFVERVVRCVATAWSVNQAQVYIGGISAGGTFTNRNLTYNSDFWAGGVPASGEWYITGRGLEGQCCPRPLRTMDSSIVIVIWGGRGDVWPSPPEPPLANYAPTTKIASQYYSSQRPNGVVNVSCTHNQGHIWPTAMTQWIARTLASHPKGTPPANFRLTQPPAGMTCVVGPYTDH